MHHPKASASKKKSPKKIPQFDKYKLYTSSVQSPEADVDFIMNTYKGIYEKAPVTLREDFCGTFALCCEWAKLNEKHKAIGVDIDPEPLNYGRQNYLANLSQDQQLRVEIREDNVLTNEHVPADVVCALNFSYFAFKKRNILKNYFQKVYDSLNTDGIFILDCFGGGKCCEANEEETEYTDMKFSYFWDQHSYDPISNHAQFFIHFKRKGEKKRERVFSYDWRMWSLPELKDILAEVGFKNSYVYWEGNDDEGDGNGIFSKAAVGEECESWVAYIVSCK